MEWTSSAVHIWVFPPNDIPGSLTSATSYSPTYSHPDTSTFGVPSASFSGPCSDSFGNNFFNHTIVLNTDFCGGWAGGSFGKGDATQCPLLEGITSEESCKNFVASNPKAFEEAYWGIRSLRVWQKSEEVKSSVLMFPVSAPITAPNYVASVAPILVEDVPIAEPSWISPLIGGLMNVGNIFPASLEGPSRLFDNSAPALTVPVSALPGIVPAVSAKGISPLFNSNQPIVAEVALGHPRVPISAPLYDSTQSAIQALTNVLRVSTIDPSTDVVLEDPVVIPETILEISANIPAPIAAVDPGVLGLDSKGASKAVSTIFGVLDESTKNVLFNLLAPTVHPIVQQSASELRKRGMSRRQESNWDARFEALYPDLQQKLYVFANELAYFEAVDNAGEGDIDSWLETAVGSLQDSFSSFTPTEKGEFWTLLAQPETPAVEELVPGVEPFVPTSTPVTGPEVDVEPEVILTPASGIPEVTVTNSPFANVSTPAEIVAGSTPIDFVPAPTSNLSVLAGIIAEPLPWSHIFLGQLLNYLPSTLSLGLCLLSPSPLSQRPWSQSPLNQRPSK